MPVTKAARSSGWILAGTISLPSKLAPRLPFSALTLEGVVAAIESCGAPEIAAKLRERYIDFSPIHALIDDWEPYAD